jgi:DNA-binding NtrC family response regulator
MNINRLKNGIVLENRFPNMIYMKSCNKRIFIVDDDPFWTAVLTQQLNELGYTDVSVFNSGADCIKQLHRNPNMVFLDYQMEEMDGLDVLVRIKEYYPGIGVVFCTAHEDLEVAVYAMKSGSFDYLLKINTTKEELITIIESLAATQVFTENVY